MTAATLAFTRGDVLRTEPRQGYWGCAVVLSETHKTAEFHPRFHVGATPFIFRYEFGLSDIDVEQLKLLRSADEIRVGPDKYVPRATRTCIGIHKAKSRGDIFVLGTFPIRGIGGSASCRAAQPMIERSTLQEMFDSIRSDPNARWNIDGVCLWGYFFTHGSKGPLLGAIPSLEKLGYRFVGILDPDTNDEEPEIYYLHVEREELHTVDTLLHRNAQLSALAKIWGLDSYDGMDVGPVERADV